MTDGQKGVETVGACWYAASSHTTNTRAGKFSHGLHCLNDLI